MERSVILVSGRVQKVGYRSKVIALAQEMGIVGWVGNLPDGRVKVVAEGDAAVLDRFASALKVKNSLIEVAAVEVERHDATGEFDDFSKLVDRGETDSRLDRSAELLKELIDVTRHGFSDLGQKMDRMLDKQDQMLDKQDETIAAIKGIDSKMDRMLDKQDIMIDKQDQMLDKQDQMLDKQDQMLDKQDMMIDKQDQMLDKQDQMLDKQDETTGEVRGLRSDMKGSFDMRLERIETALKEKGII
ncbi:acylphosphatase [Methanothrix harundinacea]|nr:acylphosphatase [Methanothrix harundinacea]